MAGVRFPDFICVGAQKAGTTWLQKALLQHPQIWLPPLKEIHYFDRLEARKLKSRTVWHRLDERRAKRIDDTIRRLIASRRPPKQRKSRQFCLEHIRTAELTDEWYGSIFSAAPPKSKCGEITPEYALLSDGQFQHMASLNTDAKLIFIMRDPIDRSWSALRMAEKRDPSGQVAHIRRIKRQEFVAYSDYGTTIDRIHKHFSPNNILLLFFDELVRQPERFLLQVTNFIGVPRMKSVFSNLSKPVHVGLQKAIAPELYDELRIALLPIYEKLLQLDSPFAAVWYKRHYT